MKIFFFVLIIFLIAFLILQIKNAKPQVGQSKSVAFQECIDVYKIKLKELQALESKYGTNLEMLKRQTIQNENAISNWITDNVGPISKNLVQQYNTNVLKWNAMQPQTGFSFIGGAGCFIDPPPLCSLNTYFNEFKRLKGLSDTFFNNIIVNTSNQINKNIPSTIVPNPNVQQFFIDKIIKLNEFQQLILPNNFKIQMLSFCIRPYRQDSRMVLFSNPDQQNSFQIRRTDKNELEAISPNGSMKIIDVVNKTNEWYHIAIAKYGINGSIFVNGKFVNSGNNSFSFKDIGIVAVLPRFCVSQIEFWTNIDADGVFDQWVSLIERRARFRVETLQLQLKLTNQICNDDNV